MESELAHGEVVIGLGSTGQGAARAVLHRATQGRIRHCALVRRRAWRLLGQATSDVVALGLPVEATISDGILQDVAPVKSVLSWLRARAGDKRWLVNADDTSWVSSILPKGNAGTVIVTSQDARASRLLGARMATVNVDAMESEEAVCVMLKHFQRLGYQDAECRELVDEITDKLNRLAFARAFRGVLYCSRSGCSVFKTRPP
jgi:hypothetical protein